VIDLEVIKKISLDVTANTDDRVDCVLLDFYPVSGKKRFIFKISRKAKECNSKHGEIQLLKTYLYSPIDLKSVLFFFTKNQKNF
jgi:hypothetical protein